MPDKAGTESPYQSISAIVFELSGISGYRGSIYIHRGYPGEGVFIFIGDIRENLPLPLPPLESGLNDAILVDIAYGSFFLYGDEIIYVQSRVSLGRVKHLQ